MKFYCVVLLTLAMTADAIAQGGAAEMTAADLYSFCGSHDPVAESACRFYVLGVVQGLGLGAGGANDKRHFCIPDNVPASQLVAIFQKTAGQLKSAFPSDMTSPAVSVVAAAVVKEFPCR